MAPFRTAPLPSFDRVASNDSDTGSDSNAGVVGGEVDVGEIEVMEDYISVKSPVAFRPGFVARGSHSTGAREKEENR